MLHRSPGSERHIRTPLAKSPDWLKAAPMRENLRTSWRQSGQKQDHCPSLLNHNAKYKRLLPPCCDFANGVRPYPGQLWKHDSIRVIVVAVSPNTVTYEDLSRSTGVTRDSLSNFLTGFIRLKSPAL